MAKRNSERLINLVIALLVTERFVSREQIRHLVDGYAAANSEAAFQRMFERDKEDLRALGVEIQVGGTDPTTGELDGYRIRKTDFYLPELQLTVQESTLVALASSVWNESVLAEKVGQATTKLRVAGAQVSSGGLSFLAPRLTAREAGFTVLWDALQSRTPVSFSYHGHRRTFQPWRLISRSGAWYVLGMDLGVGEERMFKLTRIEDQPSLVGEPGSYDLPDPGVVSARAACLEPGQPVGEVVVALRDDAAGHLRRRGEPVEGQAPAGFELVRIPYGREDEIVAAICAAGPNAMVVDPGAIREAVIARLSAVAGVDQ